MRRLGELSDNNEDLVSVKERKDIKEEKRNEREAMQYLKNLARPVKRP